MPTVGRVTGIRTTVSRSGTRKSLCAADCPSGGALLLPLLLLPLLLVESGLLLLPPPLLPEQLLLSLLQRLFVLVLMPVPASTCPLTPTQVWWRFWFVDRFRTRRYVAARCHR